MAFSTDSAGLAMPPAAIHIDLDGSAHIYQVHGWAYQANNDPLYETGLKRALELLNESNLKATLFVVAADLDDPGKLELLTEAVRRGHEIASHSMTHRRLPSLDADAKRREVFESRERLSTQLGVHVRGFRAPAFAVDRQVLELIGEAGYTYDSSAFPTKKFAKGIGVSELDVSPHWASTKSPLIEVPLPSYSPLPVPFHPSYSLVLGWWYFRLGLRRFRRKGVPLILLFHLTDFAEALPSELLPNWQARFFTLSHMSGRRKRQHCRQILQLVKRNYRIVTTDQVLADYVRSLDGSSTPGQ